MILIIYIALQQLW